jgi:hypothetical protein
MLKIVYYDELWIGSLRNSLIFLIMMIFFIQRVFFLRVVNFKRVAWFLAWDVKNKWLRKASELPIFKFSSEFSRKNFLLLCSQFRRII